MKKSVMMIPLLSIAVIGTIFMGRRYSIAQTENMDVSQKQATVSENDSEAAENTSDDSTKQETASSEETSDPSLEYFEENSDKLSLYEYLDYISLKNDRVDLAVYGDIDINEPWVSEMTEAMTEAVRGEFTLADHSYPGYDSYQLYIEQTAQDMIEGRPDVILYALPALPDKVRDMGLAETEEFMGYTLDRLLTLEETKVVLLEPYPIPGEFNQRNSRSLDYRSYLGRMTLVGENYDLTQLALHSEFIADAPEDTLEGYFEESDGLNEAGTQHVFSVLDALLSDEM